MNDLRELAYSIGYKVNDKGIGQAEKNADKLGKRIDGAGNKMQGFNTQAQRSGSILGDLSKAIVGAYSIDKIKDMGVAVVKVSADFEQSMANVKATMMPTQKEFVKMEKAAMDAGATTKFSATESADALYYLASAGYDATKSTQALSGLLDLAAAGNMEIAETAEMATGTMTAMGIKTDQLGAYADALAKAAQKSNSDVRQLGEGMAETAGVATSAGLDFKKTATWLGILADSNIKGSEGGNALRNTLLNLTAPNQKNSELLKDMGVKLTDTNGKFLDFNQILIGLKGKLSGYTQAQQQAIKEEIAGKENIQALNVLLTGAGEKYKTLTVEINNSTGAAKAMADIQQNTLKGAFEEFTSSVEDQMIKTSKNVDLNNELRGVLTDLKGELPKLAQAGTDAFSTLIDVVKFTKDNSQLLKLAIEGLVGVMIISKGYAMAYAGALGIVKIATMASAFATGIAEAAQWGYLIAAESGSVGLGVLAAAQWALNVAMDANLIGVVIVGIGLLVGAIILAVKYWDNIKKAVVGTWTAINENPLGNFLLKLNPVTMAVQLLVEHFQDLKNAASSAWSWLTGDKSAQNIAPSGNVSLGMTSGIRQYATGTDSTPSTFIAGEKGPELVTNKPNHKVYTASETAGLMSGGGSGGVSMVNNVTINVSGSQDVGAKVKDAMEDFFAGLQLQLAL